MDTFNWRHQLFYRLQSGHTLSKGFAFLPVLPFFPLLLPQPQSWKGTRPDSGVLWGSAQLLFIKQLRPLFEGYHTYLYRDTNHTLQQMYGNSWEGWRKVRMDSNVRRYNFVSHLVSLSPSHIHPTHKLICLTPKWIKLPVFAHFQEVFFKHFSNLQLPGDTVSSPPSKL